MWTLARSRERDPRDARWSCDRGIPIIRSADANDSALASRRLGLPIAIEADPDRCAVSPTGRPSGSNAAMLGPAISVANARDLVDGSVRFAASQCQCRELVP